MYLDRVLQGQYSKSTGQEAHELLESMESIENERGEGEAHSGFILTWSGSFSGKQLWILFHRQET